MTLIAESRPWPRALAPFWWAARALWQETLGFRFEYPVEVVAEAARAGSLRYHVYSERLFHDAMVLDAWGIPRHRTRTFETYNPAYVAWYGLRRLERSQRGLDQDGVQAFADQVQWLAAHAVRREDDAAVWPLDFDWREGRSCLRAPWISAMVQGLAMSALVRAHRMTGDPTLLDLALGAAGPFGKGIADGGVRAIEAGRVLYEEYPAYPLPRVLDGFLLSLLGLWDLAVETGDERIRRFFADGLDGLAHALPFWDYRGRWSWYGAHGYLCPPHYHRLNTALLTALERLSGDGRLGHYARAWDAVRLSRSARAEILILFLVTKNRCRLRHLGRLP